MTARVGVNLLVTASDAGTLAAAYQRAAASGISGVLDRIGEDAFSRRHWWLVDSSSRPDERHLVKVEQLPNGQVRTWCECFANWRGSYCKHIAWVLHEMGLLPEERTA